MNPRMATCVLVAVVLVVVGCSDDGPTRAENDAPTAFFTATPGSGMTDTDFQFDASGCADSEDADSVLVIRWDWENDGSWDTAFSTTKTATHRYETDGTKTINLEVKDSGGLTGATTRSVVVYQPGNMVLIPAGTFTMGSDPDEGYEDERPEHQPYISAFYMGLFEVTNTEYLTALVWALDNGQAYWDGSNIVKSSSDGTRYLHVSSSYSRIHYSGSAFVIEPGYEDHPVMLVSWYGATAYCNWWSESEGLTPCYDTSTWECNFSADGYRLPTEAEWEKGARGSSDERTYPWGDEEPDCGRANVWVIDGECVGTTESVGSYSSGRSPYGLYDMAGNVTEWCNDWYGSTYYVSSPESDPRGPSSGSYMVVRGGSYSRYGRPQRSAFRYASLGLGHTPGGTSWMIGFRCVRNQ